MGKAVSTSSTMSSSREAVWSRSSVSIPAIRRLVSSTSSGLVVPSKYKMSTGVTLCRPAKISAIFSSGARSRRRTREVLVRRDSTKESLAPFNEGSLSGALTDRFSSVAAK